MTPSARDIPQKPTFPQLVEKVPAFYGTKKLLYRVHCSPPLVPVLRARSMLFFISFYLLKAHFNITLPSTSRPSQLLFPSCFPPTKKNPVRTSSLTIHGIYFSPHPILLDSTTRIILCEEERFSSITIKYTTNATTILLRNISGTHKNWKEIQ